MKYTVVRYRLFRTVCLLLALCLFVWACSQTAEKQESTAAVEKDSTAVNSNDSIDAATGLVADAALPLVVANCTACHSPKLITQNRATREGWKSMIVWMQETQNLWDLGENEDTILDYLSAHYAPVESGRRKQLSPIEWYDLEP